MSDASIVRDALANWLVRPRDKPTDHRETVLAALARLEAAEQQRDALAEALRRIIAAAESLSRPGVTSGSIEEHVRAVEMTAAIQAATELVGGSIFPELGVPTEGRAR